MIVRVVAFARLRELLGFGEREYELPERSKVEDVWAALDASGAGALATLRASTRFALNGTLVDGAAILHAGDEVAVLPPVGGG